MTSTNRPAISDDLRALFAAEFANERAMRAEARTKGSDDQNPADPRFVPEAHLDSALDSWAQMPDFIQADLLGITALPADEQQRRCTQVKTDLLALIEEEGGEYPLRRLV